MSEFASHRLQDQVDGIHTAHRYVFGNQADREAFQNEASGNPNNAVAPTAADVGAIARQSDDDSFWILQNHSPVTWLEITSITVSTATTGGVVGVVLVTPTSKVSHPSIANALAAANPGDIVLVGPGTYQESITVPDNVSLKAAGPPGSAVIAGAAPGGTRVTLGSTCVIAGFAIAAPNDAAAGLDHPSSGVSVVVDCLFQGTGSAGSCLRQSGTGQLLITRTQFLGGSFDAFLEVLDGGCILALGIIGAGVTAGNAGVRVENGARLNLTQFTIDTPNVTDGIRLEGGQVSGGNLSIFQVSTAIHVTTDGDTVDLNGGSIQAASFDLLIDAAVTLGAVILSSLDLEDSRISIPSGYSQTALLNIDFSDSTPGEAGRKIYGEQSVGRPEDGSIVASGEGGDYTRGMVVLTTDAGAGPGNDGGNFIDESVTARSFSGSTFSFQGVAAGHSILFGSTLLNQAGALIRHQGLRILQAAAAVELTPDSFIWEIWDGAAWVPISVMAVHTNLFHRYAREVFIRSGTSEVIRYGVDPTTTWATKVINGTTAFWSRVRIVNALSSAPSFEQVRLGENHAETNTDGTHSFFGRSRFIRTLPLNGNIWAESGNVVNASIPVGSGGLPTGWSQETLNNVMNQDGDAVYSQFVLPRGIDTSFPLSVRLLYVIHPNAGSGLSTLITSLRLLEAVGVLEADPAGGITPVPRTQANTELLTGAPGIAVTQQVDNTVAAQNRMQSVDFSPYPIDRLYEGDVVLLRIEHDLSVGGGDIAVMGAEITGVNWTHGAKL